MITARTDHSFTHLMASMFPGMDLNSQDHQIFQWINNYLVNPKASQEEVEDVALTLLNDLQKSKHVTSQKRYRFHVLSPSKQLLNFVFEEKFRRAPNPVILATQRAANTQAPFYPYWKQICWINVPSMIARVFGSTLTHICACVPVFSLYYILIKRVPDNLVCFFRTRVLCFAINYFPTTVIRAGNIALSVQDWAQRRSTVLIVGALITRQMILLGPHIPYVTDFMRRITFWRIVRSAFDTPETLASFLLTRCWMEYAWVSQSCNAVSAFFLEAKLRTEVERLSICQSKAYAIWNQVIQDNVPKNRSNGSQYDMKS